jgi:hypothetical protein
MNDNTTQGKSVDVDDNDPSAGKEAEQNSAPHKHSTDSTEVEVTPTTVAELHRRLLAADSAVTGAETHLTAVTELMGAEEATDTSLRSPNISAELNATINKLEETAKQIDKALTGARTLQESAEVESSRIDDADGKDTTGQTSIFDEEEYVRNTSDTCSDEHSI